MQLDHRFSVPAPIDEAWKVLLDVPRIAPCMPGATLTEFDGDAFTGTVKVKLGPISLLYRGKGCFVDIDADSRRIVIEASGRESRGSGTASATVTSTLVAEEDGTRVDVTTDLKITGRPAQFGRGVLDDVGAKLLGQFAECLASTLGEPSAEEATPIAATAARAVGAPEELAGPQPAPTTTAGTETEVEAIDLLEITGAQDALRRYGPVAVAVAGLATLAWLIVRRRRR